MKNKQMHSWRVALTAVMLLALLPLSTIAAEPYLVKDINLFSQSSMPSQGVALGNIYYFTASDEIHGRELWKSDGTEEGTVMVKDIYEGSSGSNPNHLTVMDGLLYFSANDGIHGE
ncbi:hypothetical protein VU12_02580, partial [Desulfobulbus sp. US4]|nr:hypothetical protein [Desulfobulbus sp. US4]